MALIDDKLLSTEDKVNKIKQKIDNNLWPKYRELRDFSVDRIVNEAKNSSKFNMVKILSSSILPASTNFRYNF
jgi:CRISPR/Cas system-associated endonuclease/helicase Cas3